MDTFARVFRSPPRFRKSGELAGMVKSRYGSWDTGIGAEIEAGKHDLASLEKYMLARAKSRQRQRPAGAVRERVNRTCSEDATSPPFSARGRGAGVRAVRDLRAMQTADRESIARGSLSCPHQQRETDEQAASDATANAVRAAGRASAPGGRMNSGTRPAGRPAPRAERQPRLPGQRAIHGGQCDGIVACTRMVATTAPPGRR